MYNTKKSVCMLVKSKKFDLRMRPCIKLGNNRLQYVTSYKYLGCLLTDTLCDNGDVSKTLRGIYARANMLLFDCCKKGFISNFLHQFLLYATMVELHKIYLT